MQCKAINVTAFASKIKRTIILFRLMRTIRPGRSLNKINKVNVKNVSKKKSCASTLVHYRT